MDKINMEDGFFKKKDDFLLSFLKPFSIIFITWNTFSYPSCCFIYSETHVFLASCMKEHIDDNDLNIIKSIKNKLKSCNDR